MLLPADYPYVIGLDISQHQGVVDFEKVAQDFDYIFIRLGHGYRKDSRFLQNVEGAEEHKIAHGAYYFYSPYLPPKTQVDLVDKWLKETEYSGDLPFTVDVEQLGVKSWLRDFLVNLKSKLGIRRLIIYTRKDIWDYYGLGDTGDYFWWAQYPWVQWDDNYYSSLARLTPRRSEGLPWTFWQFTEKGDGKKYGESFGLDLDAFNGTISDLKAEFMPEEAEIGDDFDITEIDIMSRLKGARLTSNLRIRSEPSLAGEILRVDPIGTVYYILGVVTRDGYLWGAIQNHQWMALENISTGQSFAEILEPGMIP